MFTLYTSFGAHKHTSFDPVLTLPAQIWHMPNLTPIGTLVHCGATNRSHFNTGSFLSVKAETNCIYIPMSLKNCHVTNCDRERNTMSIVYALPSNLMLDQQKSEWQENCTHLKIRNSWSISESPRKIGRRDAISANMHPTDHTSTGVEYRGEPSNTSGARYQSVTTWSCTFWNAK